MFTSSSLRPCHSCVIPLLFLYYSFTIPSIFIDYVFVSSAIALAVFHDSTAIFNDSSAVALAAWPHETVMDRTNDMDGMDEMDGMCIITVSKHPHKIFSAPFIRPEDLHRYDGVTKVFKLSTRNFDTKRIEKVLKAYINKRYDGNLVDLLNTAYIHEVFKYIDNSALNNVDFFERITGCDDDCESCDYCKELLEITKSKRR